MKTKNPSKWIRVLIPGVLLATWLTLAGIGGPYFGKISDVSSTDLTTFLPKSAESTKVNDKLAEFRDEKTIPILVVYSNNDKKLTASDTTALKKTDLVVTSMVAALAVVTAAVATVAVHSVSAAGNSVAPSNIPLIRAGYFYCSKNSFSLSIGFMSL